MQWRVRVKAGADRRRDAGRGPLVYAMGYPLRLLHFETQTQNILILRWHLVANQYSATVLFRFFVEIIVFISETFSEILAGLYLW